MPWVLRACSFCGAPAVRTERGWTHHRQAGASHGCFHSAPTVRVELDDARRLYADARGEPRPPRQGFGCGEGSV